MSSFSGIDAKLKPTVEYDLGEWDVQEHRWTNAPWMHGGTNPRSALWPDVLKMPVLHVRQVAKLSWSHAARCRLRHKRSNDLHDSAVSVLGCSVSFARWLGMTEGGRWRWHVHRHRCCGRVESVGTGPTDSPRVLQSRINSTEVPQIRPIWCKSSRSVLCVLLSCT